MMQWRNCWAGNSFGRRYQFGLRSCHALERRGCLVSRVRLRMQLFLDFAGYSHIAIGAARALGFTVPENFARPFQSTNPSIFWTRWHMSLSFWIRDYVFLPLAVVRREMWWRNFALVVSMILFGLWHKATVLFVLWGCYHGVLLVLHRQIQQLQRKFDWTPPSALWTPISWLVTIALVSLDGYSSARIL